MIFPWTKLTYGVVVKDLKTTVSRLRQLGKEQRNEAAVAVQERDKAERRVGYAQAEAARADRVADRLDEILS